MLKRHYFKYMEYTNHKIKIVINSNKHYRIPLNNLLKSIIEFCDFNFFDIILVVSQSDENVEPQKTKISNISDLNCDIELTTIGDPHNGYDYSGYNMLNKHLYNSLIYSDFYVYLLDTSEIDDTFNDKIKRLYTSNKNKLYISKPPHSNICAFGINVIENFKDNFDFEFTKEEAINLEISDGPLMKENKKIESILSFGNISEIDYRKEVSMVDVYNTGHLRTKFYYESFGVYKYIFFYKNGDITNNIKLNFS